MSDELQEWQRPPFEPGNVLALKHGIYSVNEEVLRRRREREEAFAAMLLEERPDLAGVANAWHLTDFVREAIIVLEHDDVLGRIGSTGVDNDGLRERLKRDRRAHARRANEAARELGLGPRNWIAMAKEHAEAMRGVIDLEGIRARGLEAARARGIELIDGGDDDAA